MDWIKKVKSFTFSAENEKEAYLKGCKRLAKYMASPIYKYLVTKIERTAEPNTFTFTIYTQININEEQKKFCKICKETHKLFYVNDSYNCNCCTFKTFLKRTEERANISRGFYKERIE